MDSHIEEAYIIPSRYGQKRTFLCHSIVKMLRIQEKRRILKAAKEKCNSHQNCIKPLSRKKSQQRVE
jgi:hypothetical protein